MAGGIFGDGDGGGSSGSGVKLLAKSVYLVLLYEKVRKGSNLKESKYIVVFVDK